ncbi:MAG TPA: efflux RND transporter periplasmic adaptor subunit, partial [Myxococcota bacterium]|nr:efflux RND transporter periplasmic adaptor subunit [Myxococcota bacterium]
MKKLDLHTKRLLGTLAAIIAVFIVGLALQTTTKGNESGNAAHADNDAPVLDGDNIRFSDAFAKRAAITDEEVKVELVSPVVTVNGTMTFDPRRFVMIGARISGRVRKLVRVQGDEVKEGDLLAEIESAELGRAESSVLSARAKEKVAEADMKRERHLADAHISPERDAEVAQANYEAARAERIAAEQAVTALGGRPSGQIGVLALRSPIAGRVVSAKAARGQVVEPSVTMFEVADLASLWLELHIFERDIAKIRVGDEVAISPMNDDHRVITGKVDHVGDVVDSESRTTEVRVIVDNTKASLRPGESVVARIETTSPATRSLSVSKRAITRVDGQPTVFVLLDKNTVAPRVIELGASDPERVAVKSGLKEGDRVVVGGMFALK